MTGRARGIQLCFLTLAFATANRAGAAQLSGDEWRPVEVRDTKIPADAGQFVRFGNDGKLEGNGGCNRFFGAYELAVDRIKIGSMGSTMMECQEPVMEREKRLLQALETASRFARHGADLALYDDAGNSLVRFVLSDGDKR